MYYLRIYLFSCRLLHGLCCLPFIFGSPSFPKGVQASQPAIAQPAAAVGHHWLTGIPHIRQTVHWDELWYIVSPPLSHPAHLNSFNIPSHSSFFCPPPPPVHIKLLHTPLWWDCVLCAAGLYLQNCLYGNHAGCLDLLKIIIRPLNVCAHQIKSLTLFHNAGESHENILVSPQYQKNIFALPIFFLMKI